MIFCRGSSSSAKKSGTIKCTKKGKKMREPVVLKQHYSHPKCRMVRHVQQDPISQRLWGFLLPTSWDFYPHYLMLIRTLSDNMRAFKLPLNCLWGEQSSPTWHILITAHLKGQAVTESKLSICCIYLLLTEQNLLDLRSISRMPQLVEQQAQVVCGWAGKSSFNTGYGEPLGPSQRLLQVWLLHTGPTLGHQSWDLLAQMANTKTNALMFGFHAWAETQLTQSRRALRRQHTTNRLVSRTWTEIWEAQLKNLAAGVLIPRRHVPGAPTKRESG